MHQQLKSRDVKVNFGIPTIVVHDLKKRFPIKRSLTEMILRPFDHCWATALDGVDLEVKQGEVFGLLGPNGAGKTTLVKILCTLLLPTEGRAAVSGYDVAAAPREVRRAIGYSLDTERSFYYRLTGIQNLAFFASLNNIPSQDSTTRISEVLEIAGLNGAASAPFMTYSKGMQQKLGLARALLTDPTVLLLDEPTKSLDPGSASEFRRFLRNCLSGGMKKTVLLVTHSLEEARECCDRLAVMHRGRIAVQGTWLEVEKFIAANGFPGQSPIER